MYDPGAHSSPLLINMLNHAAEGWFWPIDPRLGKSIPELLHPRPQITTLCGSTRFVEYFNHWRQVLTLHGVIVLSIEIVTTQQLEEDPQHVNRPNKIMLDLLHFEKIRMSDSIFVLNVGGYIGESTRNEIEFAKSLGKTIDYLEDPS
jgi:hypothetical protein